MIELTVQGAGWLLGHPGWALALASWAVAVGLVVLGAVALVRGLVGWSLVAVLAALAWRILRPGVARKGRTRRNGHSALYERHVAGQSPAWRALRTRVLERAGGRCEGCDRFVSSLDVHHLTYARLGRERLSDLRALCVRCHTRAHGGRPLGFRRTKNPSPKRGRVSV